MNNLQQQDPEVFAAIQAEEHRQQDLTANRQPCGGRDADARRSHNHRRHEDRAHHTTQPAPGRNLGQGAPTGKHLPCRQGVDQ